MVISLHCAFDFSVNSDLVSFSWSRGPLYDRLFVLILYEKCVENPTAKVIAVDKSEKKKL
jgi:hypothetical protein